MKIDATKNVVVHDSVWDILMQDVKTGSDALALWVRYARQARMQNDASTRSVDSFMANATGFGETRLKNAKALLKKHGLIDVVPDRNGGRITEWVVRVNWNVNEETAEQGHSFQNRDFALSGDFHPVENDTHIKGINTSINIKKKKEKEEKEDKQTSVDGYIVQSIIRDVYDALIAAKVPKKAEVPIGFAKRLSKNADFSRACEKHGGSTALIKSLMGFALNDKFWSDKVLGVSAFERNWPTLYSQADKAGKLPKKAIANANVDDILKSFL